MSEPCPLIDAAELLRQGGTITLAYHNGDDGEQDEHGEIISPPYDPAYIADAHDAKGVRIGYGAAPTLEGALTHIERWPEPVEMPFDNTPPF
jgi:hypothetical protein